MGLVQRRLDQAGDHLLRDFARISFAEGLPLVLGSREAIEAALSSSLLDTKRYPEALPRAQRHIAAIVRGERKRMTINWLIYISDSVHYRIIANISVARYCLTKNFYEVEKSAIVYTPMNCGICYCRLYIYTRTQVNIIVININLTAITISVLYN